MSDCTLTQRDNTGKNFSDCDFTGQDLSGYIFRNCILTGANFSGCTLDAYTDFTGASFGKSSSNKATSFSGCNLTVATFSSPANFGGMATRDVRTNLTDTKLSWSLFEKPGQHVEILYIDLTGASFTDIPIDLSMRQLTSVTWKNFDFTGKTLKNTHFNNCDLTGCIMTGCILDSVSFVQVTDLTNVKMNNCSLYHTVFDGSTMTNTDLSYATKIAGCSFLNTWLKGTIFDGNNLTTCKFGVPDLTSTDPAYITSFQFATLTADFLITNLQKKWQCADFRNAKVVDFSSITNQLYNVQAQNSFFNNTLSFEGARLNGSNFNNATFNGVNFKNAFINNASLVGATTAQGNELGRRGVIFIVSQNNTSPAAPYNYDSFLNDLTQSDTNAITNVFAQFGYTLGNITCSLSTDPVSKNPAWIIVDRQTQPNRTYMVVMAQIFESGQFELLVYDNSPSSFSSAFMIGTYMEDANFSNAKMDHTQLYGSVITYADLSNADFTGAQLGKNSSVFSIAQSDTTIAKPYDYTSFLTDLQGPDLGKIIDLFQHYGYTVSHISCTTSKTPPLGAAASWSIVDNQLSPPRNFTVVQTNSELDVFFDNASPAVLDYSYMSGIILTQANMTGCTAIGCHLYNDERTSSYATLNHTTLVGVRFDNANLFKADFTSAIVNGASFVGANLMGATFKGVTLDSVPSGTAVNLDGANLQGVDFSASIIKGANLLETAICLPTDDKHPDQTYGVWLKSVKQSDNGFESYISELNNASVSYTITSPPPSKVAEQLLPGTVSSGVKSFLQKAGVVVDATSTVQIEHYENTWEITDGTVKYFLIPGYDTDFAVAYNVYLSGIPAVECSIPYPYQLQNGTVPQSLIDLLKTSSAGAVSLNSSASIDTYQRPNLWTIYDPTNNNSYTLWWGVQLLLNKLNNVIYVRSSFRCLTDLFRSFSIDLRQQTFIRKTTDPGSNKTIWMIDMGKQDAYFLNTGYIQFKVVGNSATSPAQLDIYGYTMRMQGLGNNRQEMIQDFDCEVTQITAGDMDDQTILPNNYTKIQNTNLKIPFNQWMQVYKRYPTPPACVPTGISYCQRPMLSETVKKTVNNKKNHKMTTTSQDPLTPSEIIPKTPLIPAGISCALTAADMAAFNALVRAQGFLGAAQSSVGQTQLWNFFGVVNEFAYDHYRLASDLQLKTWMDAVFKIVINTKSSYQADGDYLTGAGMYNLYMYNEFNATCIDPPSLLPNDNSRNGFPENCDQRGGRNVSEWNNPLASSVPWLFFYWGYWHPSGNHPEFYTAVVKNGVLLQNEMNKQKGSTTTIAIGYPGPSNTFNQIQQFQQSRFNSANWTNSSEFVCEFNACSLWQNQRTTLNTLLNSIEMDSESYLYILYLLMALSTSTVADQQVVQKVMNTVTSSMEYANDTFMNQLVYLMLMQMADPLGTFGYNNGQLKTTLTDLINAIGVSNAASKIILTSLQNHLKILNSDSSYPMQDPYNPNIGFNTRQSDTISALDEARGTMSL